MSVVLDSSATLAWVHGDERTAPIEAAFDRIADHGALVPRLWHLEIANGLAMAVRRGRMTIDERAEALADLGLLDIIVDDDTERLAWGATIDLADRHGLSAYDAAYLELAQRKRLALVTLDGALIRAARTSGVALW